MKLPKLDCGCAVGKNPFTGSLAIEFCPIHAAAPAMKKALEEIIDGNPKPRLPYACWVNEIAKEALPRPLEAARSDRDEGKA